MSKWLTGEKSAVKALSLMDTAGWETILGGKQRGAWASSYWNGIVFKRASMARGIPLIIQNNQGDEIQEKDLPFQIRRGLKSNVWMASASVDRFGAAYWYMLANRGGRTHSIRWYNPQTIEEDYDQQTGVLKGFKRHLTNRVDKYFVYDDEKEIAIEKQSPVERLAWVWSLGLNEVGRGFTLEHLAKLPASLLVSSDATLEALFDRGAIAQHVVLSPSEPPRGERDRILAKVRRALFGGVDKSNSVEILNKQLEFQKVGTDPKDLDLSTIDVANQKDISVLADTPMMLVDPDVGSNRALLDRVTSNWVEYTILPHTELIVHGLNHHVFNPNGYNLELQPQALTVNMEDETNRASAFQMYVSTGVPKETAAAVLGIHVPEGMELDIIAEETEGVQVDGVTEEQVLNGAQIQSAIAIIDAYSQGLFPRENATFMVETFFNLSPDTAQRIVPASPGVTRDTEENAISDGIDEQKAAEIRRLKKFLKKNKKRPFKSDILTPEEIKAVIEETTFKIVPIGDASGKDTPFPQSFTTKAPETFSPLDELLQSDDREELVRLFNEALGKQYREINIKRVLRGIELSNTDELRRRIEAELQPIGDTLDYDAVLAILIAFALLGKGDGLKQVPTDATGQQLAEIDASVRKYAQDRMNSLLGVNPPNAQFTNRIDSPFLLNSLDDATLISIMILLQRAIDQLAADGITQKKQVEERFNTFIDGEVERRAALIADDNASTLYGAAVFLVATVFNPLTKTWLRTRSADPRDEHLAQVGVTVPFNSLFPSGEFWSQELINCKCGIRLGFR